MTKRLFFDSVLTERSNDTEIQRHQKKVTANSTLTSLLDTMPHIVMILNRCRQIVWANSCLLAALEKESIDEVIGLRPGEAFGCVNAVNAENGCGTAKECQTCGALVAILQSLKDNRAEQECMILTTNNDAYNLRVKSGNIELENEVFSCVSIVDISDEKNKRMLERLFFHDIMNVAGSIQGFTDILSEMVQDTEKELADLLAVVSESAKDMIELLKSQKDLLSAENNELSVYSKEISANNLAHAIQRFFERNELYRSRHVQIQSSQEDIVLHSDERLLKRVIVNAVKNALEAINEGDCVSLGYKTEGTAVLFEIHNNSYIPEENQSRIFRKSFSTKNQDRGIGTYSIKLFTEKFLKGKVWFVSHEREGTTFYIMIPNRM